MANLERHNIFENLLKHLDQNREYLEVRAVYSHLSFPLLQQLSPAAEQGPADGLPSCLLLHQCGGI